MLPIPQSVTKLVVFKAYLASDHVSEATAKTIAITISKNGGAFGNPNAGATNATEISSGWYKVSLDTTDTGTVGPLAVRGAVATVDDVGVLLEVVKATNGGFTGVPDAVAGASSGLIINGSNSGTVTLAALTITGVTTHTGNVVLSDGLTISAPSTGNRAGLEITGNGTGAALKLAAGATGKGIAITTTAGDGLSILPTAGSAIVATGNGTSKHGIIATGGTAGTSDGISAVAGTGGVPIRGDITGNITGNLSGSAGSVSGAVGSVTGLTAADVGAIKTKTDFLPSATAGAAGGLQIAGSNAATTYATLTSTGAFTVNGVSAVSQTGDSFGRIGALGAGLTGIPWNAAWDAEVESEVDDALIAKGLDHLVFTSATGTDIADNSIIAKLVSKSATADWDSYANTTDALEALRDRGDAAWITATGFAVAGDAMTLTASYDFAKGTVAMTEAYAADGAAFSPAQGFFMLWSALSEFSISGTTITAKKLDGSTTAMSFTLDDAVNPTSRTRS